MDTAVIAAMIVLMALHTQPDLSMLAVGTMITALIVAAS